MSVTVVSIWLDLIYRLQMAMWRQKLCASTDEGKYLALLHYWQINIKVSKRVCVMYTDADSVHQNC